MEGEDQQAKDSQTAWLGPYVDFRERQFLLNMTTSCQPVSDEGHIFKPNRGKEQLKVDGRRGNRHAERA